VETSIYRSGGLQIHDEKVKENSSEFPHVLLEKWHKVWIKCHVDITLSMHLKHVQNEVNVRILIRPIKAQLKP